ncbi:ribosome-recycling factor, mitochondrial-like isoform X1 [Lingula anatina]|uniref:Ribosome-recycling factor, mitochondrial n=1 Tax=Lingula anatina TaxID=7574 RepID=A0A1S3HEW5_LINAN|nr:ribosome-recycling factor, mitochondrial-like isoform X1 [Lingula anatina]|eukprot:XP_013384608.1 ribosome-recycling factor, mitochondrial-like isoform X1 [Lingula anatina]
MASRALSHVLQNIRVKRSMTKPFPQLDCSICQPRAHIYLYNTCFERSLENGSMTATFQLNHVRHYAKKAKGKGNTFPRPETKLTQEELNALFSYDEMIEKMSKAKDNLKQFYFKDLRVRTSSGALTEIDVSTSDGTFPLNQIAKVVQKSPQLVVVDATTSPQYIKNISDALFNCNMGLNPQQEGLTLYIPIPKVTKEHREKLVKSSKTKANEAKKMVEDVKIKYQSILKKKHEHISKDTIKLLDTIVQTNANRVKTEIDEIQKAKEKDLLP